MIHFWIYLKYSSNFRGLELAVPIWNFQKQNSKFSTTSFCIRTSWNTAWYPKNLSLFLFWYPSRTHIVKFSWDQKGCDYLSMCDYRGCAYFKALQYLKFDISFNVYPAGILSGLPKIGREINASSIISGITESFVKIIPSKF